VKEQEHASVPLRRVVLLRELGDFLYTLKAGPAGGLRPPANDTTVTGEPVSPSTPAHS
jgi:hypothetical protein